MAFRAISKDTSFGSPSAAILFLVMTRGSTAHASRFFPLCLIDAFLQGHHPTMGAHPKFTNYAFNVDEFMRMIYKAADLVREKEKDHQEISMKMKLLQCM